MSWIAAGTAAVSITAGVIGNAKAKKAAKKLAENRPKLTASPYLDSQINLAESELSNGVSARSEQMYNNSTDRSVSASLGALLQGGGSVNNVSDLFDATDQGRQRFAMMNDNLRLSQINNLMRAQNGSETQRQQAFQFNEVAPWMDQAQAVAAARQGAQRQINQGINTGVSAFMGYAQNQGWGTGQNRGLDAGVSNVSGSAPQSSGYLPPQSGYSGTIGGVFPQAPISAPSTPLNYNTNYGYTPYQNRPQ